MKPEPVSFRQDAREHAKWYLKKFVNHYGTQFCNIEADYAALWQLIDVYDVRSVLEIGTWEGYAMMFMWLHPNIDRAMAVDICRDYGSGYHQGMAREKYGHYFRYTTPVQLLIEDSNNLVAHSKEFDMVFVDGDHSCEQATRDLATAKRIAKKIVAFHDWDNGNPGVNEMILAAPDRFQLVSGTSVTFVEV